jgi:hypothetical protein
MKSVQPYIACVDTLVHDNVPGLLTLVRRLNELATGDATKGASCQVRPHERRHNR